VGPAFRAYVMTISDRRRTGAEGQPGRAAGKDTREAIRRPPSRPAWAAGRLRRARGVRRYDSATSDPARLARVTTRRWHAPTRADRGPAPDLGAVDSPHLVRRVIVQDVTASTGSGKLVPPSLCDVTSADGMASLLATVLAVSGRLATLLLEELAHTKIRIEVLDRTDRELTASEHYRLDAGPITSAHHRAELLRTKDGIVAAETELIILPQSLPVPAPPWPILASHSARSWRSSARGGWTAAPLSRGLSGFRWQGRGG
jgi:hypothetical protein